MSPDVQGAPQVIEYRRSEIAEAVRRLILICGDETRTAPESADALYLVTAIQELERWSAWLTPATLSVEQARRDLDMVFVWRDRKEDATKAQYQAAVDAVVVAASATRAGRPSEREAALRGHLFARLYDEGRPAPDGTIGKAQALIRLLDARLAAVPEASHHA